MKGMDNNANNSNEGDAMNASNKPTVTTKRTDREFSRSITSGAWGGASVRLFKNAKSGARYIVAAHLPAGEDLAPLVFRTNNKAEAVAQFNKWDLEHVQSRTRAPF